MIGEFEKRINKWRPLILREDHGAYLLESIKRIEQITALRNSGEEGLETVNKLDYFGDLLSRSLRKTGLNPTEFACLAEVDERKFFFAQTGLLTPEEFLDEDFLANVDKGFKKHFGIDVDLHTKATKLLSS